MFDKQLVILDKLRECYKDCPYQEGRDIFDAINLAISALLVLQDMFERGKETK